MSEQYPTYATTNYLEWLHPGLSEERRARQEEIHRRMSQMMVEAYWRQIHENRERFFNSLKDHTDVIEDFDDE